MSDKLPFSEVVALYGPTVLRVCRAVLSSVDADDAWSEAFVAALRAYPALPSDANLEAWLVTIAHRKAIDHFRKAQRSATPVADVPAGAAQLAAGAAQLADVAGPVDLPRLLANLSERQRLAVVYHYLGGLPYAEVAAVMGGSPDAARRAAADGIARLRRAQAATAHSEVTRGSVRRS